MAGEKRKRRGRRAYLDDFQRTATGEYVYTGKTHRYRDENLTRRQALTRLWALTAVMAGGVVAAGCLPAAGTFNTPYVILPYASSLLSAGSVVWLMCRLTAGGDPLPDYVHAATVKQFGPRGTLTLVFSAATVAGELLHLALNGAGDRLWATVGFLACEGLAAAGAALWRVATKKLDW